MNLRTSDALALGTNGNLQGGMRCFVSVSVKVLHRKLKDITAHKIPTNDIS